MALVAVAALALWPSLLADLRASNGTPQPPAAKEVEALLAFKVSGGAANDVTLASWAGDNPCGGAWRGATSPGR
jgi:hypothetical protein